VIETTITRVHTAAFGNSVVRIAKAMSTAEFYLELDPPDKKDIDRGVGKYAIKLQSEPLEFGTKDRLDRTILRALTFALAEEIERLDGVDNPVLRSMWMLDPRNRQQVLATSRSLECDLIIRPKKT